jgi:hypothetical protein
MADHLALLLVMELREARTVEVPPWHLLMEGHQIQLLAMEDHLAQLLAMELREVRMADHQAQLLVMAL